MIFSLLVQAGPGTAAGLGAYRFASAALAQGHAVFRVFFYREGVRHGDALAVAPPGEPDLPREWQSLAQDHGVDLVCCVGSALRHGVLDEREAARHGRGAGNLLPGYELAGLGQLVEAIARSDRLLGFG